MKRAKTKSKTKKQLREEKIDAEIQAGGEALKKATQPTTYQGWVEKFARNEITWTEVPKEERARWVRIATEQTNFNTELAHAVWAGKKPQSALKFEDEGGEMKRVGWPDGYDAKLAKDIALGRFRTATGHHATEYLEGTEGRNVGEAGGGGRRKRTPSGEPKPKGKRASKADTSEFKGKTIKLLVKKNPKKEGSVSAARFDFYENGITVDEFVARGGTIGDVRWDLNKKYIALE